MKRLLIGLAVLVLGLYAVGCRNVRAVTYNEFRPDARSMSVCGSTGTNANQPLDTDGAGQAIGETATVTDDEVTALGGQTINVGRDITSTKDIDTEAELRKVIGVTTPVAVTGEGTADATATPVTDGGGDGD